MPSQEEYVRAVQIMIEDVALASLLGRLVRDVFKRPAARVCVTKSTDGSPTGNLVLIPSPPLETASS